MTSIPFIAGIGLLCGIPLGFIVGVIAVMQVRKRLDRVDRDLDYSDGF
jgi:hypothetical protein